MTKSQLQPFTSIVLRWNTNVFVVGICLHAFVIGVIGQSSSTLGPTPVSTTPPDDFASTADVIKLTVYRTSSISYEKSLGNANAASVAGEIGFLQSGCSRRRSDKPRREDNGSAVVSPAEVYSPCEASDVITRHTVMLNSTFSCYVMMNGGDCTGCLSPFYISTPPPDQTCSNDLCSDPNISWSSCEDVLQASDGLVGRQPAVFGGVGWWYSFQAFSECGPEQQIGDDNCTWKEIDEQKHVPVCCVNLYNTTTFLDTFEECHNVSSVNISSNPMFESACPTPPSVMPTRSPTTLPTVMPTHQSTMSASNSPQTTTTNTTVAVASTTDSFENASTTKGPDSTEVLSNETTNESTTTDTSVTIASTTGSFEIASTTGPSTTEVLSNVTTNETTMVTTHAETTPPTTLTASPSQSIDVTTTSAVEVNTSTPITELNTTSVSDSTTVSSSASVTLSSTSPDVSTSVTLSDSDSTVASSSQSSEKATSVSTPSRSTASMTMSASQVTSSSSPNIVSATTIANNGYSTSNKHSPSNDAGIAIGVAVVVAIVVLIIAFAIGFKFSGSYTALATTTSTESMMMTMTSDHHDNPSFDYASA
eukprot:m.160863 g.160863  ORF g.160863 m.160863 type:complete len:592 (-) comp31203_c0_seq2:318-2093(-)